MKRASPLRIIALSADPSIASQIEQDGQHVNITLVKDLIALQRMITTRSFDGMVLEGKRYGLEDFATLRNIDLSNTFVLAGPLPVLDAATKLAHIMGDGRSPASKPRQAVNLEQYVESKLGDFVRAMKRSSAGNLYLTWMKAVERPLIELALRETNGNQNQASQLLGMNRNTLRKKMTELEISAKRRNNSRRVRKRE